MSAEQQPPPMADKDFWTRPPKTFEELAAEQGVKPWTEESIAEMHRVGKEIWPEDDIEDFLAWLRETRRGGRPKDTP